MVDRNAWKSGSAVKFERTHFGETRAPGLNASSGVIVTITNCLSDNAEQDWAMAALLRTTTPMPPARSRFDIAKSRLRTPRKGSNGEWKLGAHPLEMSRDGFRRRNYRSDPVGGPTVEYSCFDGIFSVSADGAGKNT